jgi:hypothetical protein
MMDGKAEISSGSTTFIVRRMISSDKLIFKARSRSNSAGGRGKTIITTTITTATMTYRSLN